MNPLTPTERRALRAQAHHLQPVVIVGHHGLTPAVLHEVDLALTKHELVKVRVGNDERAERNALLDQVCAAMHCAAVQHLGKVLVLWRPSPEAAKAPAATKSKAPERARKSAAQRFKAPKTGPRAPPDPVRERRRGAHAETAVGGKGTRGAARFDTMGGTKAPLGGTGMARQKIRARGAAGTAAAGSPHSVRGDAEASGIKRKSSYTPKTTPKSFSAKPNPREAWAKRPAAGNAKPAGSGTRRRRKA
jgi:RNA-binding protein